MSKYDKACSIRGDGGRAIRAIRAILDQIGDKWTLLVVATLHGERLRFGELQQRIPGIFQRMLTRTLHHLERDGLVTRTVDAEVPPRVEYELTSAGQALVEPAVTLAQWAIHPNPDIEQSQLDYDART